MHDAEKQAFFVLMADVYAFYRQDLSRFALNVWWQAMKTFDGAAVRMAFDRHCVNPDNGQFLPKPSDIVRLLQGSTQDSALAAWAKVDRVMRTVGSYRSVLFDDPIILAVVQDMGGWVALGMKTEAEWPFVAREFENRYRGYALQPQFSYPRWLVGAAELHNAQAGQAVEPPLLVGDADKARALLSGACAGPQIVIKPLGKSELNDALSAASVNGGAGGTDAGGRASQ
ncbi:DUF6475 domain-containing protein [Alcaligenes sp. WGS1538]|uniref:DUF6475 domain-containing protein n=1 Tax=Alcaligenes sp. WGS1538 TaxID=3366811 RepID=UPI00372D766D